MSSLSTADEISLYNLGDGIFQAEIYNDGVRTVISTILMSNMRMTKDICGGSKLELEFIIPEGTKMERHNGTV